MHVHGVVSLASDFRDSDRALSRSSQHQSVSFANTSDPNGLHR